MAEENWEIDESYICDVSPSSDDCRLVDSHEDKNYNRMVEMLECKECKTSEVLFYIIRGMKDYVDVKCSNCHKVLLYMKWQV